MGQWRLYCQVPHLVRLIQDYPLDLESPESLEHQKVQAHLLIPVFH